jgi:hypothetical protein
MENAAAYRDVKAVEEGVAMPAMRSMILWSVRAAIMLAAILAIFRPDLAGAGMVTGHVHDERGLFQPGATFSVKVSADKLVKVKTDGKGDYRVFLQPGIYTVEFPDKRTTEILSRPEPIKQDIHLK